MNYYFDNMKSNFMKYILNTKGYYIYKNILSENEIKNALELFNIYIKRNFENFDYIHSKINIHNIIKYHQIGHQEHAWYLRTRKKIIKLFADVWNTNINNLCVSFDGTCYIKKTNSKFNNKCWTHTDQAPKYKNLKCYQGFVSLTNNKYNSLLIYEGSHKLHEEYFKNKNLSNDSKNWHKIDPNYLETIKDKKKILNVPKGSFVIWDSRLFHQNTHINNEERIVQYI